MKSARQRKVQCLWAEIGRAGWQSDSPHQARVNVRLWLLANLSQFQIHVERQLQWSCLNFLKGETIWKPTSSQWVIVSNKMAYLTWSEWLFPEQTNHFHPVTDISHTEPCAIALLKKRKRYHQDYHSGVTQTSLGLHRATFALSLLLFQGFNGISKLIDESALLEMIWERIQGATSQSSAPIKSFTINRSGLSLGHSSSCCGKKVSTVHPVVSLNHDLGDRPRYVNHPSIYTFSSKAYPALRVAGVPGPRWIKNVGFCQLSAIKSRKMSDEFLQCVGKTPHIFMKFLLANRYLSFQNDFKPDSADKCS